MITQPLRYTYTSVSLQVKSYLVPFGKVCCWEYLICLSLHLLPILSWVSYWEFHFLPHSRNAHMKMTDSELTISVNGTVSCNLSGVCPAFPPLSARISLAQP